MMEKSTMEREVQTENEYNHNEKNYLESSSIEPFKEANSEGWFIILFT